MQQETRYLHTRYTHACGVWVVFPEHGGGALGIFKSPVCTYNQSWTFVRFIHKQAQRAAYVCRPRSEAPCKPTLIGSDKKSTYDRFCFIPQGYNTDIIPRRGEISVLFQKMPPKSYQWYRFVWEPLPKIQ